MNEIKVFNNSAFGQVRTAGTSENPLFCLSDVCKAVDLSNPSSVKARLDKDDVQLIDLHALNGGQEIVGNSLATFITESGFYEVILFSNSPKVKPFRKWVTKEVLPSIRKTGQYSADTPQTFGEALMLAAKKQLEVEEQQRLIEAKDKKIAEDAPKVAYADALTASDDSCLVAELAKVLAQNGYETGQNRLFKWLREHHYLGAKGDYYNMPMQQYIEQGIFKIIKKPKTIKGEIKIFKIAMVTAKGQQYFINKFLSKEPMLKFE